MSAPATPDPRSPDSLAGEHLLIVDAGLEASDVIALLSNLYPRLPEPVAVAPATSTAPEVLRWRMTRHSALKGPIYLPAEVRNRLGLPDWADVVFALSCPRDREDAPPPEWYSDADGLERHFPDGLPEREEGRSLAALIALARRLHVAVRLADEAGRTNRIITPDPESHIDIFVYSPYWLAPDVLLTRLREMEPTADLPGPLTPEQEARVSELIDAGIVDPDEPVVLDGYEVTVSLDELGPAAGSIAVRVSVETALPRIVAEHLGETAVCYHLTWIDTDDRRYDRHPGARLSNLRRTAAVRLEEMAASVISGTAGIAVDESGFLVTENQLRG